jgi:hypothetical protein
LQLLVEHPLIRVREAIESCTQSDQISAESVVRRVQMLAAIAAPAAVAAPSSDPAAPPQVHVPLPDLSRFDQLLGGNDTQETSHYDVSTQACSDQSTEAPVSVYFA